jgi:hypothetical protein
MPLPPLASIQRRAFDYGELEVAMAHLNLVVRQSRRPLGALGPGVPAGADVAPGRRDGGAHDAGI